MALNLLTVGDDAVGQRFSLDALNRGPAQALVQSAQALGIATPYTVSQLPGIGRFTTIQGAINRAALDGANYFNPAVVDIFPGYYAENLDIPTSGIALRGVSSEWLTYLAGTITCHNQGTQNAWSFDHFGVENDVEFAGTSTSVFQINTQNMQFFGRVNVQEGNCGFTDYLSRFHFGAADPLRFQVPTTNVCEFTGSSFNASLTERCLLIEQMRAYGCRFNGPLFVGGALNILDNCELYTSLATALTDASDTLLDLFSTKIYQAGTPAINKTGAGILRNAGNYLIGAPVAPYIAIGGGSVQTGTLLV